MSKIQELLAAQRGKENVNTQQKIEPAKIIENVNQKLGTSNEQSVRSDAAKIETSKPQSLVERLKGSKNEPTKEKSQTGKAKSEENKISENQINRPETVFENAASYIKEIMPEGLSLMAQMKWRREHAIKSIEKEQIKSILSEVHTPEISQSDAVQSSGETSDISSTEEQNTSNQGASQKADAQKTNDGVINIEELKHNLAYLANNIESKELVANIVRTIAVQLKTNPILCKHMSDGDFNLMVRGLRMGYQVAAMAKQNKEEAKKKASKGSGELDAMFKAAGIDFSF